MGGEKLESFGIIASLYFSALLILEFARGRTSLGYEEIKYKFIGFWCLQVNEALRPGNRHPLHTVRSIRHPAEVPSLWRLSHWPSHPSEPNPASDGDGFHPPSPIKDGGEGGNDGGNKGWEEAHHRWGVGDGIPSVPIHPIIPHQRWGVRWDRTAHPYVSHPTKRSIAIPAEGGNSGMAIGSPTSSPSIIPPIAPPHL